MSISWMRAKILSLGSFLVALANYALAAPPVLQTMNHPVGIRALESFAGADLIGKDGRMARIGFDLATLYQEHRDFVMQGGTSVLKRPFRSSLPLVRIRNEKVVIDVAAVDSTDTLVQELIALGMENISTYGRVVSGRIPISSLEQAATISQLKLARPAYARVRSGLVSSQGDAAMLSDVARTTFAVDGTGITIGTLSDSYDCQGGAAGDVATNDLPATVVVLAEETGCGSGTDEGRAMMQIIHDVAPGSTQAFHTAFGGEASFASGIIELATVAGADIVNDDAIYFAEPMFQDGIIAQAVDTVKAMGVPYFSAAGNNADASYEDSFRNSSVAGFFAGSLRHDFDSGAGVDSLMQVSIPVGTQVTFVLQWDDPYFSVSGAPGADTDVDIILYSSVGQAITGSFASNIGGDPVEIFAFFNAGPSTDFQLGIEHFSGPFPGKVKFVYFGTMSINEFATNSATSYGHAIATGGQAVGAARYSQTPEFGVSPPILELFSSRGGIPVLFDTAGNPVNTIRQKPDFVAPDGGDTTFFGVDSDSNGWPNFFGTSAAAPHAAGIAALIKEFDNTLSPDAVYATLQSTAIDMNTAGFDFDSGYGLIQATSALQSLDDDSDGLPDNLELSIGTDPLLPDTDGDGLSDLEEVAWDGDASGYNPALDLNPLSIDTDGDGFEDGMEVAAEHDPLNDADSPVWGDIDDNGVVDVADLLRATRAVLGIDNLTNAEMARGNVAPLVNGQPQSTFDDEFGLADLLLIKRKVLGLITF